MHTWHISHLSPKLVGPSLSTCKNPDIFRTTRVNFPFSSLASFPSSLQSLQSSAHTTINATTPTINAPPAPDETLPTTAAAPLDVAAALALALALELAPSSVGVPGNFPQLTGVPLLSATTIALPPKYASVPGAVER